MWVVSFLFTAAGAGNAYLVNAQLERDVGVNDVDVDSRERARGSRPGTVREDVVRKALGVGRHERRGGRGRDDEGEGR